MRRIAIAALFPLLAACSGPVWYGDVQVLVQNECSGCHVAGAIGTIPLESYDDAKAAAERMKVRVSDRSMPPWNPSEDCLELQNDRHLDDSEIEKLVQWVDMGSPMGKESDSVTMPALDTLTDADLELDIGVDYTPDDQGNADDYHCFVLDPGLAQDSFVTAIETLPDVRRMVHHVIYFGVDRAQALAHDNDSLGAGWTCFGGPGPFASEMLGGWVPGQGVLRYPERTGIPLSADQVIVAQYHYNFDGGPAVADRSGARIQLAETVDLPASLFSIADGNFAIPPGAENYQTEESTGPIPGAAGNAIWASIPHMHQLGETISMGVKRGGQDRCFVEIPEWDFNWQQFYFFDQPFELEDGDDAYLRCSWNNPTDQVVTWGDGTTDEMCIGYAFITESP